MLLTRRHSRAGISTVIGAIFFVLVVFLVFTSTIIVFESFSSYAGQFKQVNQQDVQNKAASLSIQNMVFGGVVPPSSGETTVPVSQNTPAQEKPLYPVSNMNLSSSMTGWTFSKDYKIVRDNGWVNNTFLDVLPGATTFTLIIENYDPVSPPAQLSTIFSVSLQVDTNFPIAHVQLAPAGWTVTPNFPRNSILWTIPLPGGITNVQPLPRTTPPGALNFTWTAISPSTPGTYFQTVTLTWATTFDLVPIVDSGTAPVMTNVVTSGPGGESTNEIVAQPLSTVPGGISGGFDQVSTGIGSESGPGSLYLDFQPTLNGSAIVNNQQLAAQMNYTTAFNLDSATTSAIIAGACCSVSYGYSLDQLRAPPTPLVLINVYLVQLTASYTVNQIVEVNSGGGISATVPSIVNHGNGTGWIMSNIAFNPTVLDSSWVWTPGNYELVVSVTASMAGTQPASDQYPSTLIMHFDDVGLALKEAAPSYYADDSGAPIQLAACVLVNPLLPCGTAPNPAPVDPSQVQSIHVTAELAQGGGATLPITAYVYIGDVSRESVPPIQPIWYEIGQVNFVSSVTFNAVVPASASSVFIDNRAPPQQQCSNICVRVYAISPGGIFSLNANVSVVIQTWEQNTAVVSILNNGTSALHVVSALISGPSGIVTYQASPPGQCNFPVPVLPQGCQGVWINPGQTEQWQVTAGTFTWITDQNYLLTVVTDKGLIASGTFTSP